MASSAPDPLSPRAREIVAAARAILDEKGESGLSMRNIAARLGIRAPSLYKHLPDKQAVEAAIISDGFAEQAAAFEAAVRDPTVDPLDALARVYRSFARRHPHLYRLMTDRPLPRERLLAGVEARAGQPVREAAGNDVALARAIFAFAHGMTILELNDRFPQDADVEAAWQAGLAALRPAAASRRAGR